jgi:hypothetical protein
MKRAASIPDKTVANEQRYFGLGADLIMTVWIIVVAVAYYAGLLDPEFGRIASGLTSVYALMLLTSVVSIALRYLRRKEPSGAKSGRDSDHN